MGEPLIMPRNYFRASLQARAFEKCSHPMKGAGERMADNGEG
jgi:hypothetical protein